MILEDNDVYMRRGDTEGININFTDEVTENIVPLIAGDKVYLTVKKSYKDTEKAFQKVITEFIDGEAIITIYPEDTKELEIGKYLYDVQFTSSEGYVKTIIPPKPNDKLPKWIIQPEVTYE